MALGTVTFPIRGCRDVFVADCHCWMFPVGRWCYEVAFGPVEVARAVEPLEDSEMVRVIASRFVVSPSVASSLRTHYKRLGSAPEDNVCTGPLSCDAVVSLQPHTASL